MAPLRLLYVFGDKIELAFVWPKPKQIEKYNNESSSSSKNDNGGETRTRTMTYKTVEGK